MLPLQVIIVKLADRLHNMRTIWALQPEKARYLARETLDVWCPMCEYLGLSAVKAELEDICFAVNDAVTFKEVHRLREQMLSGISVPEVRHRAWEHAGCAIVTLVAIMR
jgi:(p)ppGpp synthase/HD superfamily hydrolase